MAPSAASGRRILILIGSLAGGGAERSAARLACLWAEQGRQIAIVVVGAQRDDEYPVDPAIQRYWLNLSSESKGLLSAISGNYRRVRSIRRVIRSYTPDTAIAFMETANILLALATIGLPVRTIGCERTYPPQSTIGRAWRFLRDNGYGLLDTTVAQTDTTAKWLLDNTRTCHVTVIPNAINCPAPANGDSPESETLAGQRKILAAAGRLHPLKGFNHLVSAFASICQTRPDWCLMIAGEGDQREALEAQISQLGLHDRIFMLGRVKNINAFFSRADIFALTSSHEGFPNVLLEAMACGLPAVSFDCEAGPRAIIRDGEDGILVPPGDRDALASAIASLMDDENRRRKMGSAATLVCDRFSPARVLQLWDRVLHNKTLS